MKSARIFSVLGFLCIAVTSNAATYFSRASAAWNVNSTWSTVGFGGAAAGAFPVAGDIVNIGGGFSVTINAANAACTTLNINNGSTLTVGGFTLTVSGVTTVGSGISGSIVINSATGAKTFGTVVINASATWNNTANAAVSIGGNLSVGVGATFTQGTGRVTFTGATNNTVTNTGTIAFGGGITVNKGTSQANVIDFQGPITMLAGGLTLTNGTFKLSSASTITAFTADPNFGATSQLWCNGGTILATNTNVTYSGAILVSAGTLNIGTVADNYLYPFAGTLTISGGAVNVAGALSDSPLGVTGGFGTGITFNMSAGTCTVNTVGVTNDWAFYCDANNGSAFTMTGGNLVIQNPATFGGLGTRGYFNSAASTFTGGTLQIGNASTPASSIIGIDTSNPIFNLAVNSANVTAEVQNRAITVSNNVTISSGNLNANNQDISLGGNWINNGTFLPTTATVTLSGTAQTISGNPTTFYNLSLSGSNTKTFAASTSAINNLSIAAGVVANLSTILTHTARTLTLNGNGQISGTWGGTTSSATNINSTFFTTATGILTITTAVYYTRLTGNWNNTSTWSLVGFGGAAASSFPVAGDEVNIGGGNFTVTVNVNSACGNMMYQSNATFSPIVSISSGITLNVSGLITIPRASNVNPDVNTLAVGAGILNAGSIAFTNGGNAVRHQMTISTGTVTVTGDITTDVTGTSATIAFTGAGTLNAGVGIFTTTNVGGTLTTFAGSTVNYNGAAQTINSANYLGNLTFSGSGVKTMTGTTSVGGNFTLSGSASTTPTAALTIGGNVILGTGTTFTAGAFTHNVAGNWTNNGATFTNTGSTINLNGTVAQTVGGTTSTTFNNLTLNNTFGTIPQFTAGINTTVTGTLTMTSGVTNLAGFTFTLGSSGVASILSRAASTTTNWMYGGTFRRFWLNATAVSSTVAPLYGLFPVGSSTASSYRPVAINSTVNPTATGSYSVTHTDVTGITDLSPVFNDAGTNIVRKHNAQFVNTISGVTGGTYNIGVTMTGLVAGTLGNIRLGVSNGATTVTTVGTHAAATGSAPIPTANRTGVTLAGLTGDFRITSTNIAATPLPIELTSFNAFMIGDQVKLSWSTASELNNDFFTIERSAAGEKFETVKTVKGKGTTNLTSYYQDIDKSPLTGKSYYRLKQTDFDGHFSYSEVVIIENNNAVPVKIYPNPIVDNKFTLEMNGLSNNAEVPMSIINMQGVIVHKAMYQSSPEGRLITTVELSPLPSGVYVIVVNAATGLRKKVVIP
jgi:Secretion system C-terminal sorting domain